MPRLTVDRRIVVHLFELKHSEMDFDVPYEAVQDGMADAVSIRRDNIPRTVKKLKEEDLIYEVLKRVKGLPRKRKAYFLTDKGMDFAREILHEVGSLKVTLKMTDGSVKIMPFHDVASYMSIKLTTNDLSELLKDDSSIDEVDVRSFVSGEAQPSSLQMSGDFVSFMQDVPVTKRFYGRERELTGIKEWLSEDTSSMISITGIAGIGKTTLAAKAAKEMDGRVHVFWYRFHKWDSLRNVLYSISRFLEEMGRTSFKNYLDTTSDIEKKQFFPILQKSLTEGPILMIFDDFQRAADEVVEFFSDVKEILPSTDTIKIMVVGRQVFPFYDRSDVLLKKLVRELNLVGLDKKSSRGLLKIENMSDEMFEKIYVVTKGHPLFLQLILSARDLEDQKDIKRYIYEEIFKKLEERESLLLQIASVFRYPAPSSAFFMEEGLDFTTLDRLVETNLIQETSYDEYEAHDLIKEFFYNRLTPSQRIGYHRKASNFYMEDGTERATVEAMYHLAMGGETIKALKLASTYGERIITMGYVEQFSSVLDLLEKHRIKETEEFTAISHLLKGEVELIMGRWDKSLSQFKRAAAIAEAEDRHLINVRSNLRIGWIEFLRGNRERALKRLEKSLKLARKLSDKEQMAKSLQALGDLYSARGELEKSKVYFKEALTLTDELDNPSIEAASFIGLGIVYTNQDRPKEAIRKFQLAVEALERTENILETARVKISMGVVQVSQGDYEEALMNFEDAIEICSEAGDIRQQGYALSGAAEVYIRNSEHDLAANYLDEALSIFTSLGEKFKIAMVHKDFGRLHLLNRRPKKALREFDLCMKILGEIGSSYYMDRTGDEISRILLKTGHKKEAKRYKRS